MMTVRDVMTTRPISVRPDTPLKEVARLLVEYRISGVPVVDADRRVLGIVSEADLLVKEQGADAIHHRRLARVFGESERTRAQLAKLDAVTAGDAMTRPPITIGPERSIAAAAATMGRAGVNRLPVVDTDDRLVGIVSRADLVRAFVRSDDGLAETIREDVLHRTMWLNPVLFDVVVRDGVVRIAGRVERRATADAIVGAIALVPGVVRVVSDVSWALEDDEVTAPARDLVGPYGPIPLV